MNMLLFLGLFCGDLAEVDLDQLGFSWAWNITLHEVSGNLLVHGTRDALMVLLDPKTGRELARYDRAGQGPGELENPHVLGVAEDKLAILSNQKRVFFWTTT